MYTCCYQKDQINEYKRDNNKKLNPLYVGSFSENCYYDLLLATDRIENVNKFKISNLPNAWTSLDIENLLYTRGSICCYSDENGLPVFAPFTLTGSLDIKGNLYNITPILLNGEKAKEKKRAYTRFCEFDFDETCCVIIKDYTGCLQGEKIISRMMLNATTTISDEVKSYKILLYNIIFSIKKMIASCDNEEQVKTILKQAELLLDPTQPILAFTKGTKNVTDDIDITQFVDKAEVDNLTRAIDFYNRVRRLNSGIPSPDTFEKKERMITSEVENVNTMTNLILYDGLENRKIAFDLINKCFGLDIQVEINPLLL